MEARPIIHFKLAVFRELLHHCHARKVTLLVCTCVSVCWAALGASRPSHLEKACMGGGAFITSYYKSKRKGK